MNLPGHSDPCQCAACAHRPDGHGALLSMCDVEFHREGRKILDGVNFTVDRGDFIAVTGPNGGGKTTLLRLILGLLSPSSGRILYFAPDGSHRPRIVRPGYLPQKNSVDAHFPITVREVVASGLLAEKNIDKSAREAMIEHAIELIELSDLSSRPIGRLSGGQLQRALFGRAIVSEPDVLILDEPLSYIDSRYEEHLCRIVEDISRKSTVILVSHQMNRIAARANRHVIVDHSLRECTHNHHYAAVECD